MVRDVIKFFPEAKKNKAIINQPSGEWIKDLGIYLWTSPGKQQCQAAKADCTRQQGNKKVKHHISPNPSLNNPLSHLLLLQLKHVSYQTGLRLGFSSITSHSASVFVRICVPLFHVLEIEKKKKGNILQRMILPISWVRKMRSNPIILDPYSSKGWTRESTL